jgi:hypothetical protein
MLGGPIQKKLTSESGKIRDSEGERIFLVCLLLAIDTLKV